MKLPKVRAWYSLIAVFGGAFVGYIANGVRVNPPLASADLAAWVQAVGSIGAILSAVWVLNRQNEVLIQRADSETLQLIRSIGDEVEVLHELFSKFSGPELMSATSGAFLYQIPMTDAAFKVFNSSAGKLGCIQDEILRRQIVVTYAKAYGFVESVGHNNIQVGAYVDLCRQASIDGSEIGAKWAESKLGELAIYGPKLRLSYTELIGDVDMLTKLISQIK